MKKFEVKRNKLLKFFLIIFFTMPLLFCIGLYVKKYTNTVENIFIQCENKHPDYIRVYYDRGTGFSDIQSRYYFFSYTGKTVVNARHIKNSQSLRIELQSKSNKNDFVEYRMKIYYKGKQCNPHFLENATFYNTKVTFLEDHTIVLQYEPQEEHSNFTNIVFDYKIDASAMKNYILSNKISWYQYNYIIASYKKYFQLLGLSIFLSLLCFSPVRYIITRFFLIVTNAVYLFFYLRVTNAVCSFFTGLICCDREKSEIGKKREIYLDILRIVATFSVIFVHVTCSNVYWGKNINLFSYEWNIFNIYESLSQSGTNIFVMISGVLFLTSNYSIKKIYKKKILRIVIAFMFWSVIYTFLCNDHSTVRNFIINFSSGNYHMWFLYMIIGLYMLVPFFKKIIEDEFIMKYFLILSFIFSIILRTLKAIITIPELELDIINTIVFTNIIDIAEIHFVVGYSFYFILGYFLHKIIIDCKKRRLIYFLGVLGLISTILLTILISKYLGKHNGVFYNRLTIPRFFYVLFIFVIIKNIFTKFELNEKSKSIIIKISNYSFGAYLVHDIIIKYLDRLFSFNIYSFNPLFSVPIISIIVFCLAFLISALLHKIPLLNKYIV